MTRRRVLLAFAALLALWLGGTGAAAWMATHRRTARSPESPPPDLAVEAGRLTTSDGEDLGAWYVAPRAEDAPSVVLLHALGGSRESRSPMLGHLSRKGFAVLSISLRAHGDSSGESIDFGWASRADVASAVDWLERRRPGRPILLFGSSLGAAAALLAAPDLGERAAGYFLESPYSDLPTAVRNRTSLFLPPVLDQAAYSGLLLWSRAVLPVEAERISPLAAAAAVPARTPVWLLNGSADDRTHLDDIRRVHERVASHGALVVFEGARHEDLFFYDPPLWNRSLDEFLSSTLAAPK